MLAAFRERKQSTYFFPHRGALRHDVLQQDQNNRWSVALRTWTVNGLALSA